MSELGRHERRGRHEAREDFGDPVLRMCAVHGGPLVWYAPVEGLAWCLQGEAPDVDALCRLDPIPEDHLEELKALWGARGGG